MRTLLSAFLAAGWISVAFTAGAADTAGEAKSPPVAGEALPKNYSCMFCHGSDGTLAGSEDNKHLIVTPHDLAADIHWQKGLRCHDCHGGNPSLDDYVDHRDDPGFKERMVEGPADVPGFCGKCHSDIAYMRRFGPSARTDQESEFWTSGHGRALKERGDEGVAQCVSCHGRHGILAVNNQKSPVYPTRVGATCAKCHSDEKLMADRKYGDRPLGHSQYEQWQQSVHGKAMFEKGDLSAPTCNDCHGNHGALPPEIGSVANACGTCHGKIATLFADTAMKHGFEQAGLPGCSACHGNHQIMSPSDDMLGMEGGAVCIKCHEANKFGATLAGADVARVMRSDLEKLKQEIKVAETKVQEAERLGMLGAELVRGPREQLRTAVNALTNARTLIHSFTPGPMEKALAEGLAITEEVNTKAAEAMQEYTWHRIWLALFLIPIVVVVIFLVLYIRTLPVSAD
jgi:predicted CXXCH cytochrome family protein